MLLLDLTGVSCVNLKLTKRKAMSDQRQLRWCTSSCPSLKSSDAETLASYWL